MLHEPLFALLHRQSLAQSLAELKAELLAGHFQQEAIVVDGEHFAGQLGEDQFCVGDDGAFFF